MVDPIGHENFRFIFEIGNSLLDTFVVAPTSYLYLFFYLIEANFFNTHEVFMTALLLELTTTVETTSTRITIFTK